MTGGRVLRDRRADRRLRRDGFVKLPLLSRAEAADLRSAYLALPPPPGEGFVADLNITDPAYRTAANELLSRSLDDRAAALYVDHVPFLRAFLCKHPGADSYLYIHRDWMYVDERRGGGTYVTWVALEDIDGDNGQLRVVRGSHRLEHDLRGTDLNPPWTRHQDVLGERLLSVPVRAGECLVFHNNLIHCSYPNHTDVPRVVAAIGVRPADAPLVHFFRTGPDEAVRYDVDEQFFLTHSPGGLLQEAPARRPVETISLHQTDWSAEALARRLDRHPLNRLDRLRAQRARSRKVPSSSA